MVAQIDAAYWRARPGRALRRLAAWALIEGRPLTTSGRWINPLVFALYRVGDLMAPSARAENPIYIVGTGRSGTTVLGVVLSMHRDILFLNEPKAMWARIHDGEDLIGSYNDNPACWRISGEAATPERALALAKLYSWALRLAGGRRVVDKYPELVFRRGFVKALIPRARFLFLTRHAADATTSIALWSARHGRTAGGEVHDWWGRNNRKWRLMVEQLVADDAGLAPHRAWLASATDHRDRAAVEWVLTMREGMRAQAADRGSVLRVVYEELATRPAEVLSRIAAFCGLADDPAMTDYATRTLAAPARHGAVELDPRLVPVIRECLDELGYGGAERIVARGG